MRRTVRCLLQFRVGRSYTTTRGMSSSPVELSTPSLLSSQKGNLLTIELNRPKALNSLTLDMCLEMNKLLRKKINVADSDVGAFLVKGAGGKAFCAGGDVKTVYLELTDEALLPPEDDLGSGKPGFVHSDFFRHEYTMNYLLGISEAPQISLWDGIVMGGGVGLSVLGEFRVATEKTLFAMPETAIGLFPDVGSSAWLPDLPDGFGIYIGLSGVRLAAADLMHAGIATHFIKSELLGELETAIAETELSKDPAESRRALSKLLKGFQERSADAKPSIEAHSLLYRYTGAIKHCFQHSKTVEEIVAKLAETADGARTTTTTTAGRETATTGTEATEAETTTPTTTDGGENVMDADAAQWATETLQSLNRMSPTSLKLALKQLEKGPSLDLKRCLHMEFRMMMRCMQAHDFKEGIRAVLVDKDHSPQWSPAALGDVSDAQIEKYFEKLGEHELYLGH